MLYGEVPVREIFIWKHLLLRALRKGDKYPDKITISVKKLGIFFSFYFIYFHRYFFFYFTYLFIFFIFSCTTIYAVYSLAMPS